MTAMRGHVLVVPDVADAACRLLWRVVTQSTAAHVFIALSGGSTPLALFRRLGSREERDRWPWDKLVLFWGDERPVPFDHPDSNYGWAQRLWLDHVPVPADQVHPWPTHKSPEEAARDYAATLARVMGSQPRFDLVWLGVGPEGHTASLFPGSPALSAAEWTAAPYVSSKQTARLTLTPAILNASQRVVFLLQGEDKRAIVKQAFGSPNAKLPVQHIQPAATPWWIMDQAAAQDLPQFPGG